MIIHDTQSDRIIADWQTNPLVFPLPSEEALADAYKSMIISSSGWRKVFAPSGNEEDFDPTVNAPDRILAALAAYALYQHVGKKKPTILVGLDARPTGTHLGSIVVHTLLSLGVDVRYLFITAAPQIMADTSLRPEETDAFFYISASHNPIGHNGFKFGKEGGVYGPKDAERLAERFRELVGNGLKCFSLLQTYAQALDPQIYKKTLEQVACERQKSAERYRTLVLTIATKSREEKVHAQFIETMRLEHQRKPLGILGELNGSARSCSIDRFLLTELGIATEFMHDTPGDVVHPIVPEGKNLTLCMESLKTLHRKNPAFVLGYVPDNDGDRGNIVYINDKKEATILEAQSLFALVVLSELAQSRLADPKAPLAVVVNGPTSNRVDDIACSFGAKVFRAEVGEANVVELADLKRKEGYIIPILGEGSNGGNISHPAKVRDPLNTLLSLAKLLNQEELSRLWFTLSGQEQPASLTLDRLIRSLPSYITTGAYSSLAQLQVNIEHGLLKTRYEEFFEELFVRDQILFNSFGITSYKIIQTEGTEERIGSGPAYRTPPYNGGFKVGLYDDENVMTDFLWMRGSKTEPIFRLLVDCKGDHANRHDYLLELHRLIITRALQS
ncbi:MAG TPA: phosphoglucomutase [Sphaerochaeta sp.]|nr:phosphoglucomutase [Sphaerochaeta sp.]